MRSRSCLPSICIAVALSSCASAPRPSAQHSSAQEPAPSAPLADPLDERLRASYSQGFDSTARATRAWLAESAPDTAPGLAARALLRHDAGDLAGAVPLYDECVRRFPAYAPCVSARLGAVTAPDDATLLREVEPALGEPPFMGLLVVRASRRLRDRALAQRWLAALEARDPRNWAFEYLRALEAEERGDAVEAVERYQVAISDREGAARDAAERAVALIVRGIGGEPRAARLERLTTVLGRVEQVSAPGYAARAYYAAGLLARSQLEDRGAALSLHRRSYDLEPSPEAAHEAFVLLHFNGAYAEARELAEDAARRFPEHPTPQADLGLSDMLHREDLDAAEARYRRAIELAQNPLDRRETYMRVVWEFYERVGRFEDGRALIDGLPAESADAGTRAQAFSSALRAGDLAGARERLAALPDMSASWLLSHRERLDGYEPAPGPAAPEAPFSPAHVASSADGQRVVAGADPMTVYDGQGRALYQLRRGQRRELSPDGRYLAAVSEVPLHSRRPAHALTVYEVQSGRLVRFLDRDEPMSSLAWHPREPRVAVYDNDGVILELDVGSGAVRSVRGGVSRINGSLAYSRDGRHLFSSAAQGRTVRVWSAETLELERELGGVSWAHAMATTADGLSLVVVDNTRTLSVYTIGSWERRAASLPAMADRITPHPREPVVILNGDYRDQATVFDLRTLSPVRDLPMRYGGSAAFAGERQILVEEPEGLRTYDYPSLRRRALRESDVASDAALIALEGGRALLQGDGFVAVLGPDGSVARRWPLRGIARPRPGHDEIVVVSGSTLHRVPLDGGRARRVSLPLDFDVQSAAVGDRWIVVGGVPRADPQGRAETPSEGTLAVFEIDTGNPVFRSSVPIVTRPRSYPGLFASTVLVALDEERSTVASTTRWQDGFGHAPTRARQAVITRIGERQPLRTLTVPFDVFELDVPSAGSLRLRGQHANETFSADTGERLASGEEHLELGGGRRVLWGTHRVEVLDAAGAVLAEQVLFPRVVSVVRTGDDAVMILDHTGAVHVLTAPPRSSEQ